MFHVTVLCDLQKNLLKSLRCSRETALHRFLRSTLTISKQDLEARNMPSSTTEKMNPCKQLCFCFCLLVGLCTSFVACSPAPVYSSFCGLLLIMSKGNF